MQIDRIHRLLSLLAFVALVAPHAVYAQGDEGGEEQEELDYIKLVGGTSRATKITKDDFLHVEGLHKKVPVKEKSYGVEDVLYADRDANYMRAMEYRKQGKFLTAAKYFRISLEEIGAKAKWAKEYCNYYIGDCFFQSGDFVGYKDKSGYQYQPAAVYYRECLAAKPKSRFALDCYVKLVTCLAEIGKLDEAEQAFKDAEKFIKDYRNETMQVDSRYLDDAKRALALATYGRAKMLERREDRKENVKDRDYTAALSGYKSAQSEATGKFTDIFSDAAEGEMEVLVKMEDYSGAKSRAETFIEKFKEKADTDLIPVLPAAYSAVGRASYAQGLKYETQNQDLQAENAFTEARWNFLHVIVQFFDKDDQVARAHYFAGACYTKMLTKEPDAKGKAIRHWQALVSEYPSSIFVPLAQDGLKNLGAGGAAEQKPAEEGAKTGEAKTPEAPKEAK
ncbi:MAG: hypothetical protein M5U26_17930 [Planctomycetota bacterium]|nr:hypothetical protein [Planctomycetota bacterium]